MTDKTGLLLLLVTISSSLFKHRRPLLSACLALAILFILANQSKIKTRILTGAQFGEYFVLTNESVFSSTVDSVIQNKSLTFEHWHATANMTFDEYCAEHGEWESIADRAFIKKSAVFYLVDADFLRVHVLKRQNFVYNFTLDIKVLLRQRRGSTKSEVVVADLQNVTCTERHLLSSSKFGSSFVDARPNLTSLFRANGNTVVNVNKKLILLVRVHDHNHKSNSQTNSYLPVKIKNLASTPVEFDKKKGSLLCAKCYFLNETSDYLSLKWWVEVNKVAAYDNVLLCDHGIEKGGPSFSRLFAKHRDFLIIKKLECIPNLQSNPNFIKHKYISDARSMMKFGRTDEFDVTKLDVVNQIMLNECYLDHVDKYKFIAVMDIDEVIFPKFTTKVFGLADHVAYFSSIGINTTLTKNNTDTLKKAITSDITCNRYGGKNTFEAYMTELINATVAEASPSNTKPPKAYYFNQGYFIGDDLVEQLFNGLENELVKIKKFNRSTKMMHANMSINVTDYKRSKQKPLSLEFTIRSNDELSYAVGLLTAYRQVIQPFMKKHAAVIAKCALDFDRLFVLNGYINSFAIGKTVADTRLTFDVSLHFTEHHFEVSASSNLTEVRFDKPSARIHYFPIDSAHLSHFRKYQYFSYKLVPFTSLYLDLNYLNCYFMPLLTKFASEAVC